MGDFLVERSAGFLRGIVLNRRMSQILYPEGADLDRSLGIELPRI